MEAWMLYLEKGTSVDNDDDDGRGGALIGGKGVHLTLSSSIALDPLPYLLTHRCVLPNGLRHLGSYLRSSLLTLCVLRLRSAVAEH